MLLHFNSVEKLDTLSKRGRSP